LRFHVGGQNRCVATASGKKIEELNQPVVAAIELVVAEGEGVKADLVHQLGVGFTLEGGEVEGAGDCVAGMQLENVIQLRRSLVYPGNHPRETTDRKSTRLNSSHVK